MDLRTTIEAKSDQLNATDLVSGPRTIKVTKVTGNESADQPINIYFEGDNNKPFKPCKSMRRLLVQLWGHESDNYVGKSMTLYMDETVKFAGVNVGGIRISHVSNIDEPKEVLITISKTKRRPVTVHPLKVETPQKKAKKQFQEGGFNKALKAVIEGQTKASIIIATYEMTDEQKKQLEEAETSFNQSNK